MPTETTDDCGGDGDVGDGSYDGDGDGGDGENNQKTFVLTPLRQILSLFFCMKFVEVRDLFQKERFSI